MELRQDIITVNPTTNTVTLSTESYDRLTKYLAIKSLKVNCQEHEVTSYSVPNSETCKGIIYIDRVCLGEVISEKDILPTLRECNPQMHFLEARCMGKTSDAVLVTFLGTKVPWQRNGDAPVQAFPTKDGSLHSLLDGWTSTRCLPYT
ncbi:hypothetical protein HPB50_010012 [Hyalomma asiaticum]|uniref:Uncharacterized protein n=1 Tax=Hyalomma asiaticum TaxID=266040 RepID=A0ACB7T6K0_HYAAI|nr:hypothetical protein HPB50_010012 [Hyalomma asiaticum]